MLNLPCPPNLIPILIADVWTKLSVFLNEKFNSNLSNNDVKFRWGVLRRNFNSKLIKYRAGNSEELTDWFLNDPMQKFFFNYKFESQNNYNSQTVQNLEHRLKVIDQKLDLLVDQIPTQGGPANSLDMIDTNYDPTNFR